MSLSALLVGFVLGTANMEPDFKFGGWPDAEGASSLPAVGAVTSEGLGSAYVYRDALVVSRRAGSGGWETEFRVERGVSDGVAPAFSRDGSKVAFAMRRGVEIRSRSGEKLVAVEFEGAEGETGFGSMLSFSPDGRTLAVVTGYLYHWWVRLVDVSTGAVRGTEVNDVDGGFRALEWSADGSMILAYGWPMFLMDRDGKVLSSSIQPGGSYGPYFLSPSRREDWVVRQVTESGTIERGKSGAGVAVAGKLRDLGVLREGENAWTTTVGPNGDWLAVPGKAGIRFFFEGVGGLDLALSEDEARRVGRDSEGKWVWTMVGREFWVYSVARLREVAGSGAL